MSGSFSRTLRSLDGRPPRRTVWSLAVPFALVAAWSGWFAAAPVTVYEVSRNARLEVEREVHPIEAREAGLVISTHLQLGQKVRAGDILVELDTETERRRLAEGQERLKALEEPLASVRRELAALDQSLVADRAASKSAVEGVRLREHEAATASRFADEEARRLDLLGKKEAVAELERLRARAEAEKRAATVRALDSDVRRLEDERRVRERQGSARMEELRAELARLEGDKAATGAQLRVLEEAVEKRRIRAPADGEIGDVVPLQVGSVLREGERVATLVPSGRLRVTADLTAATALGRVRPGQRARVLLDGFPWLQYGALAARVSQVGAEARDGVVRVELEVLPNGSRIPLQHGLSGVVEIDVERVTPVTLVLRSVGRAAESAR